MWAEQNSREFERTGRVRTSSEQVSSQDDWRMELKQPLGLEEADQLYHFLSTQRFRYILRPSCLPCPLSTSTMSTCRHLQQTLKADKPLTRTTLPQELPRKHEIIQQTLCSRFLSVCSRILSVGNSTAEDRSSCRLKASSEVLPRMHTVRILKIGPKIINSKSGGQI